MAHPGSRNNDRTDMYSRTFPEVGRFFFFGPPRENRIFPPAERACWAVLERVAHWVPPLTRDLQLYPLIRVLRDFIHSGELVRRVEEGGRQLN